MELNLLDSLPYELLSIVAGKLESVDLASLMMTFNQALQKRITRMVTSLHVEVGLQRQSDEEAFMGPGLIHRCVNLQHLSLRWSRYTFDWQSDRAWSMILSSPVLKSIRLEFDTELKLNIVPPPTLESITVVSDGKWDSSWIEDLPNLRHLHLPLGQSVRMNNRLFVPSTRTCPPFPPMYSAFTIETLELAHIFAMHPHQFEMSTPRLKSLTIHECDLLFDAGLTCLPQSLTCLKLSFSGSLTGQAFKNLPSSLQHFDANIHPRIEAEHVDQLPKTLETLVLRNTTSISMPDLASLPPHLTHLELNHVTDVTCADIRRLPRTLTHLDLGPRWQADCSFFEHLPRSLRVLHIATCGKIKPQNIGKLPPELVKLTMSGQDPWTAQMVERLPRTITDLDIEPSPLSDDAWKKLPNLIRLRFQEQTEFYIEIIDEHLLYLRFIEMIDKHLPYLRFINHIDVPELRQSHWVHTRPSPNQ